MKKFTILSIFILLISIVAVSANHRNTNSVTNNDDLPNTMYDPRSRQNIPYWNIDSTRLEYLLDQNSPAFTKYNDVEGLKRLLKSDMLKKDYKSTRKTYTDTRNVRTTTTNRGSKITKEEIAEAFDIESVYDNALKRKVQVRYITRDQLINHLNTPRSQELTFGANKRPSTVTKLKELGIYTGRTTPVKARKQYQRTDFKNWNPYRSPTTTRTPFTLSKLTYRRNKYGATRGYDSVVPEIN